MTSTVSPARRWLRTDSAEPPLDHATESHLAHGVTSTVSPARTTTCGIITRTVSPERRREISQPEPLAPGEYYHIYHRGNNREKLFRQERNYDYFMRLYAQYIAPVAFTYAFCLLRNHFHLLVQILELEALRRARAFATIDDAQGYVEETLHNPGRTLASAVCAARHAVRRQAPRDPTWLAYSLYAHPNARLAWDGSRG